jgi:N utilization substance protein B
MAERTTQRVVGGKLVPAETNAGAVGPGPGLPDAAMAWTGTPLSAALATARAEHGADTNAEGADDARDAETGPERLHGSEATAVGAKPTGTEKRGARVPHGARPKRAAGSAPKATHAFAAARAVARKLALQAIYRWLLNDAPWQDLVKEFGEAEDMPNADPQYFRALVEGVWAARKSLDERLAELVDRPVEQLDPVEHAVLLVGLYELSARPDVPYRVVINEAVGLAKRFGATDGHKFVNAVLDRAARILRPGEN